MRLICLDRLARSTRDLLNVLDSVSKVGAKFKSLADAWAATTTPHGELMITILAGLATFELHLIKARTDEGRKRAQARGVRFGRPLKLSAFQIKEALARREAGVACTRFRRHPRERASAFASHTRHWRARRLDPDDGSPMARGVAQYGEYGNLSKVARAIF